MPAEARDAGRGMGLTDRQLLWRVELPLALPEIMAGLRIAVTTTVGLATLAFLAGAGGLGEPIFADLQFKLQRASSRAGCACCWRSCSTCSCSASSAADPVDEGGAHDASRCAALGEFGDAINFIFSSRENPARRAGRRQPQPAADLGAPEAVAPSRWAPRC